MINLQGDMINLINLICYLNLENFFRAITFFLCAVIRSEKGKSPASYKFLLLPSQKKSISDLQTLLSESSKESDILNSIYDTLYSLVIISLEYKINTWSSPLNYWRAFDTVTEDGI